MTAYLASYLMDNTGGSGPLTYNMSLMANGTYPARISRIEWYGGSYVELFLYHYNAGATQTGGSVITPVPLRGGAPASTESVKSGATVSGTRTYITGLTTGTIIQDSSTTFFGVPSQTPYTFPFDYILTNGAMLYMYCTGIAGGDKALLTLYFEELRLSWSF